MLYEITIPQFIKMLHNLALVLDKAQKNAQDRKFEVDILLNSRLAPDMFNFIKQIQITCDTAKYCAARLTGKEAPVNEDKEKTLPELRARIEQTIGFLSSVLASDLKGAEDRQVTQPRWEGKSLKGSEYVLQNAIPNFYFHFTTAYAILRNQGVDVGKKDYLGEMPFRKS